MELRATTDCICCQSATEFGTPALKRRLSTFGFDDATTTWSVKMTKSSVKVIALDEPSEAEGQDDSVGDNIESLLLSLETK